MVKVTLKVVLIPDKFEILLQIVKQFLQFLHILVYLKAHVYAQIFTY